MSPTSGGKGRLNFAYDFQLKEGRAAEQRRTDDDPLRILLLADLSGRAQRNVADAADLGSRPCLQVGLDEYDSILMRYAPCIQWPIGHIDIQELEDFHPDRLYAKLDVFKSLRETRARLNDPSTFTETVRQLRTEEQTPASAEAKGDEQISPEDVFNRLLGQPASADQASRPSSAAGAVSQMIRQIVAPYIQPAADPRRDQYISSVDTAIGDQMKAILHHPEFQALESVWRGIWDLVTGLELDQGLTLHLLDVTKQELLDDLRSHKSDLAASGVYQQWVSKGRGAPDGRPWSVIVGHYGFEYHADDLELLAGLGVLASQAQAPFLADAHPSLLGCPTFARELVPAEWTADLPLFNELRRNPVSRWIGLAAPRILMRLPYGERSDEIDAFSFEELGGEPRHDHFLWGSSALGCAKLLGMAYQERGWSFSTEDFLELADLPAHTLLTEEGKDIKPCAEIVMSDGVGDQISRRGLIALMSYRYRNAVRVRNLQAISDPPTSLPGPWG